MIDQSSNSVLIFSDISLQPLRSFVKVKESLVACVIYHKVKV